MKALFSLSFPFFPFSVQKHVARSPTEDEEWGEDSEHVRRLKTYNSHLEGEERQWRNLLGLQGNIMGPSEVKIINLSQAQQHGFTGMEQAKNCI